MNNPDNIEKRISVVKNIIINYFYNNNIYKSSCLAQSYILYKYIYNLTYQTSITPTLIKGYIVNNIEKVYYGHFWVEYNNNIYDIATDTYLLDYKLKDYDRIKNTMRILREYIPNDILYEYKNIDNPMFHILRNTSYIMCMENMFLEDVKKNTSLEIYNKIEKIYNKIIR
jgi:hypothetical protein